MTRSLLTAIRTADTAADTVTRNVAIHSPQGRAMIIAALAILDAASAQFNGRLDTAIWSRFSARRDHYRGISAGQKRIAA